MTSATAEDREALLRQIPLFRGLDEFPLAQVAAAFSAHAAAAGTVVFREGEEGDAFYLLVSGSVRVASDAASERVILARLGPGQYFGEMALVTGAPRTAAVIAESDAEFLVLRAEAFASLTSRFPALRAAVERVTEHRGAEGQLFADEAFALVDLGSARRVVIGAGPECDLRLGGQGIALRHAEITAAVGGFRLRDLGGPSGVYLNRELVSDTPLNDGDVITVGSARIFLHDGVLRVFEQARGVRVDARGLGRTVGREKVILRDVDLAIYPGELVAIVGPSGAGKTTLLHMLLGIDAPTAGEVLYDGVPLGPNIDRFRPVLGYVPQQDIVHPELTVRESLGHAARLRLPEGTSAAEAEARIARVLADSRLEAHAGTPAGRLSGGQRKRASTAVELLSGPRILFLDEPTSGLDPGLDDQMMQSFREMADNGRTVVVTTHATRNIAICDRVVVVCGGLIVFVGTPAEALRHFDVDDFVKVYPLLEDADAAALRDAFHATAAYDRNLRARLAPSTGEIPAPRPDAGRFAQVRRGARQYTTLLRRDALIIRRDRLSLGLRVLGPPLLAASVATSFHREIFARDIGAGGNAREAITLLYLACAVALFLGSLTFSNIITRENAIYRRERLVNLSPLAYVMSKVTLLGLFSVLQGALMMLVIAGAIALPGPNPSTFLLLFAALSLTSLGGMTMGMFISSVSPNADRAAIIAVLAIVPQLIFGGSTIPRSQMQPIARANSDAMISKWSLELMGDMTGLDERLAAQSVRTVPAAAGAQPVEVRFATPYDNAFKIDPAVRWAVMAGFVVVFTGGTILVQSRKGRPRRA